MDPIDILAIAITGVGFFNCVSFVSVYWVITRGACWKDEAGQFLMLFFGCLGLVFLLVILNRILGNYPGRSIFSIVLYCILVLATGWPMRLLFGARKRKRLRDARKVNPGT